MSESLSEGDKAPLRNIHDQSTGNSLLMFAVMDNRHNIMERIVDLGCDINARNRVITKLIH